MEFRHSWYKIRYDIRLIKQYLDERVDMMYPISEEKQMQIYKEHGYIEEGYKNIKHFPSFETWKKLRGV